MRPQQITLRLRRIRSLAAKRRHRATPPEERSEAARQAALCQWEDFSAEDRRRHVAKLVEGRRRAEAARKRCAVCREEIPWEGLCAECHVMALNLLQYMNLRDVSEASLARLLSWCVSAHSRKMDTR